MAPINIPEGYVFVPRLRGENVAAQLFEAVAELGEDRYLSVRSTQNGYHVYENVAELYRANRPAAEDDFDEPEDEELEGEKIVGVDSIETIPGTEGDEPVELEGELIEDGAEVPAGSLTGVDGEEVPVGDDGVPTPTEVVEDEQIEDIADEDAELAPLPVDENSTHTEIDDYASKLDSPIVFPRNTNKADKIAALEAARAPQTDDDAE